MHLRIYKQFACILWQIYGINHLFINKCIAFFKYDFKWKKT